MNCTFADGEIAKDDQDDVDYFRQEVGEAPDPGMLIFQTVPLRSVNHW